MAQAVVPKPVGLGAGEPVPALSSWDRLAATPGFKQLVATRWRFTLPATVFFLVYYITLPISVNVVPGFMRTDVIGHINVAYLFALSQFFMTWILAFYYVFVVAKRLDALTAEVVAENVTHARAEEPAVAEAPKPRAPKTS